MASFSNKGYAENRILLNKQINNGLGVKYIWGGERKDNHHISLPHIYYELL